MAATRATVRGRIQELLGDVNPSERVVNKIRLEAIMDRNIILLAGRALLPMATNATIALVAGTFDYAIDATNEAQAVDHVYLNSTGTELRYMTIQEMGSVYKQNTAAAVANATPVHYALFESEAQVPTIRLGPTPNAPDFVDLVVQVMPTLPAADGSSILFPDVLMRAMEAACAADCIEMMDDASLAKLMISRGAAAALRAQVEQAVKDHNQRQVRFGRRQDRIVNQTGRMRGMEVG